MTNLCSILNIAFFLAITLAQEVARVPTIDAFVYISASDSFPFINPRYFSSKRQAEQYLFSRPEFRSIVFRPGKRTYSKCDVFH